MDAVPKPEMLTLKVTIPPWLEVSPRLLFWAVGEEAKPKETLLALNQGSAIKIVSVEVDNPGMRVSLQSAETVGKHRLIATPASTVKPLLATVTITLENPGSSTRRYTLFTRYDDRR